MGLEVTKMGELELSLMRGNFPFKSTVIGGSSMKMFSAVCKTFPSAYFMSSVKRSPLSLTGHNG